MTGNWNVNITVGSMPEKVATALGELNESSKDKEYSPIAYLGSQIVNGTNHAVLALQTMLAGKDSNNVVLLIFNERDTNCDLINVERILLNGPKLGGTTVDVQTVGNITNADAQKVFDKAFGEGYVGARVKLAAFLGTKVEKGTIYYYAAQYEPSVQEPEIQAVLVAINEMTGIFHMTDMLKSNVELNALDSDKAKLRLSAPWTIFYKEVVALFKKDEEVNVLYNDEEPELKLWVKGNDQKAAALARFIPTTKEFGNVILNMSVVGNDGQPVPDINCTTEEAIELVFRSNQAVSFIKHVETMFHDRITYVVFKQEVVQFFADNMTDIYGAISTLYQNIAKDVFEDTLSFSGACFFCTDAEPAKN